MQGERRNPMEERIEFDPGSKGIHVSKVMNAKRDVRNNFVT
jgi:hypothetical protein